MTARSNRSQAGRVPKLDDYGRAVLRELVEADNDAMLAKLSQHLHERTGVTLVVSALHKVLVKMGITRKEDSTRRSATATTSSL